MFYTILWRNEIGQNASDCAKKTRLHRKQKIKQQEPH